MHRGCEHARPGGREVVQGLLGLRPEVVVTPVGFAPGSLRGHDALTRSGQLWQSTKSPGAASSKGWMSPTAAGRVGQLLGRGAARTSRPKASPPKPRPCDEVVLTQAAPVLGGASACLAPTGCTSGPVQVRENFSFIFLR